MRKSFHHRSIQLIIKLLKLECHQLNKRSNVMILMNSLSGLWISSWVPHEIGDVGNDHTWLLTSQRTQYQPAIKSLPIDLWNTLAKKSKLTLRESLTITTTLREIHTTEEEHVKWHHGDAISKIQTIQYKEHGYSSKFWEREKKYIFWEKSSHC